MKETPRTCENCRWAKPREGFEAIFICRCRLSGCYNTDVWSKETCNRWEKALIDLSFLER